MAMMTLMSQALVELALLLLTAVESVMQPAQELELESVLALEQGKPSLASELASLLAAVETRWWPAAAP